MVSSRKLVTSIAIYLCTVAQGYMINIDFHDGEIKTFDIAHGNLTADEFLRNPRSVRFRRESVVNERLDVPRDNSAADDFLRNQRNIRFRQEESFNEPRAADHPTCLDDTQRTYGYDIIGDGNPHQNYKIGQVADTRMFCVDGATLTTGESHTFEWSFSVGLEAGSEDYAFGSLGFGVAESDTKSVEYGFPCVATMTEICALHYTAVTAISVEFYQLDTTCDASTKTSLGTGVVYLPNANGVGSGTARGSNFGAQNIIQCRGDAERNIDFNCGPAGGPEWFDSNQAGPWTDAYMSALDPAGCAVPIEALQFDLFLM